MSLYKDVDALIKDGATDVEEIADALDLDINDIDTREEIERIIKNVTADNSNSPADVKKTK